MEYRNARIVSSDEETFCGIMKDGKAIDISNGYINSGSALKRVTLVHANHDNDLVTVSPENVEHVLKIAFIHGKKRFVRFRKRNRLLHRSSVFKQKYNINNRNDSSFITDPKILPLLNSNNNNVERLKCRRELKLSRSDIQLLNDWFVKTKSEEDVFKFKFDQQYFMSVLYDFNPVVKLTKLNTNNLNVALNTHCYKHLFFKKLGLTNANFSQMSGSETDIESAKVLEKSASEYDIEDDSENQIPQNVTPKKSKINFIPWYSKKNSSNNVNGHKENSITRDSPKKRLLPKSNYAVEEDRFILKWVLKNENARMVKGNMIWQDLEKQPDIPFERTWQSLRNRYLKSILYNLREYGLPSADEMRLKVGAEKGSMKKQGKSYGLAIHEKDPLPKKITENNVQHKNEQISTSTPVLQENQQSEVLLKNNNSKDGHGGSISSDSSSVEIKNNKQRRLFTNKTFLDSSEKNSDS